ncbi:type VII secretion integral membrane protein EccD [Pseudonocardia sp. ICBG1122]|nr:type VII secretion integral membrane protein EccD [Pseudonocardia pini]
MDIAVPSEVALGDLLPAVLLQFGAEIIEESADHEGFVAQRLGSAVLDEDLTPRQLDLADGEQVFLRPRADQLTPIDYDDVVAGVGEQVRDHDGMWTPARTRVLLLAGATAAMLLGVPLLVLTGGSGLPGVTAVLGAVATGCLLAGAGMLARGSTDTTTGTVLAGLAAAYGAATGAMVADALGAGVSTMPALTCAAAAAGVVLTIALLLVADAALLFTGALVLVAVLVVTGVVGSAARLTTGGAAASVLALTMIAGLFLPQTAFRLSGLTLPLLPTAPDQLTDDITPVPHRLVLDRGRATVGYSAALHVGLGAGQLLLIVPVVTSGGWATVYGAVAALLLLLRSRHPLGLVPRWSMVAPGAVGAAAIPLAMVATVDPLVGVGVLWFPVVLAGIGLLALTDVMPARRLRPYWGRAVDILESLAAVAMLPLLLAVLGVYSAVRGLAS